LDDVLVLRLLQTLTGVLPDRDLTVTGANNGEQPETQDPGIWLENAGF
jgi:hypothetical protein